MILLNFCRIETFMQEFWLIFKMSERETQKITNIFNLINFLYEKLFKLYV